MFVNIYNDNVIIDSEKIIVQNAKNKDIAKMRKDTLDCLNYMFERIDSYKVVSKKLEDIDIDADNIYVVSVGKASVPMAKAALEKLNIKDGIVVTNKSCLNCKLRCIKSSHPTPSKKSIDSANAAIEILKKAKKDDVVLFLISGGASAMFELSYVSLESLIATNDILIKSGMDIRDINCIRKHLSRIKGGKITLYTSAKICSFIVSDVANNDLSSIASGLTYFDNTTFDDAVSLVKRYKLFNKLPNEVLRFLISKESRFETVKKDFFPFDRVENFIVSDNKKACMLVEDCLRNKGYSILNSGSYLTLDVRDAACYIVKKIQKMDRLSAMVIGGEVTVNVQGSGIGGRNQELALFVAEKIQNENNTAFMACATDGKDGNSPSSGAIVDGDTIKRSLRLGINYKQYLKNNDSYSFFQLLKDDISITDTNTNIADIYISIRF